MSKIWEITRTDHITIRYESIVGERVICEKGKPKRTEPLTLRQFFGALPHRTKLTVRKPKIGRKDAVKE